MIKIGFIDNFLSEWPATNYPDMIRANGRARALGMDVCYAYAKEEVSPYDGVTTDEWCRAHGVRRVGSVEELVDRSDCIAVLSPDNPELHLALSEYALKSGKPTYIDKTFAPDKATAEKLFALAKEHGTPVYSTSSLRFADEMKFYRESEVGAKSCMVCGCYLRNTHFRTYVHHHEDGRKAHDGRADGAQPQYRRRLRRRAFGEFFTDAHRRSHRRSLHHFRADARR